MTENQHSVLLGATVPSSLQALFRHNPDTLIASPLSTLASDVTSTWAGVPASCMLLWEAEELSGTIIKGLSVWICVVVLSVYNVASEKWRLCSVWAWCVWTTAAGYCSSFLIQPIVISWISRCLCGSLQLNRDAFPLHFLCHLTDTEHIHELLNDTKTTVDVLLCFSAFFPLQSSVALFSPQK